MKQHLWVIGTTAVALVIGLLSEVLGTSVAPPGHAVWNWAIGLIALTALVGIELAIAGRGFAQSTGHNDASTSTAGNSGLIGVAPSPMWSPDAPTAA